MSDFDFPSDSWIAPEGAVAEDAVIVAEPDVPIASLLVGVSDVSVRNHGILVDNKQEAPQELELLFSGD